MGTCEDIRESLATYALGALELEERTHVETHLASCARCRQELRPYLDVAAFLADGLPPSEPPLTLRHRVLDSATRVTRPRTPLRPRWPFGSLVSLPAAAVALLVLLAVSVLALQITLLRDLGTVRAENQRLAEQVAAMAAHSLQLSETLQTQRALVYLSAAPGTTVATLKGDTMPEAYGMLMVAASGRNAYLVAANLKPLPDDRAYQAWLITDGQRTSAGVFRPDASGWAMLPIRMRQEGETLSRYQVLGVTVEPIQGSVGPTGERVLFGSLR